MSQPDDDVELLNPAERALFEAYKEAVKSGLASADASSEKVLTAAFSLAAAYGALIGLVAPKETPSSETVALPFLAFAGAAVFAMIALLVGLRPRTEPTANNTIDKVKSVLRSKRILGAVALTCVVTGIVVAGFVVVNTYGPTAESNETQRVRIHAVIHDDGTNAIGTACDSPQAVVEGTIDVAGAEKESLRVTPDAGQCPSSPAALVIPLDEIRVLAEMQVG